MGIQKIENNPYIVNTWIDNIKHESELYYKETPDSLIPFFEEELRKLGFSFETSNQTLGFMPKHKKIILPIAIRYYVLAKELKKDNEQNHFMSFLGFKGFEEVVPMLIEDFNNKETPELTRWFISDALFNIKSPNFVNDYLQIIAKTEFGRNRQMIILLVGKIKAERSIPLLVDLLEDEEVRLQAICALGEFKREEFRCHFERFQNDKHPGWRKYARIALNKLNK